jgi:transposase
VERCQDGLNECRRIATRCEKPALNFLAMLKLAVIEQYLRDEL